MMIQALLDFFWILRTDGPWNGETLLFWLILETVDTRIAWVVPNHNMIVTATALIMVAPRSPN